MKRTLVLLLAVLVPALSGCSLFVGSHQAVVITATDPTAEIIADGSPVGTGTAAVNLKRNTSHAFMARTPDGRAGTATVGKSISMTGILDIVGGIFLLVPIVGLFAPGAWDLDQTNITIAVPPPASSR